jgi:hypothetical protein
MNKSVEEAIAKHAEVIYIHGPSRSNTTISEISLGQVADLVYSQPFTSTVYHHTGKRSGFITEAWYEEACQALLQKILETKAELGKERLVVVVKEVNDRLPEPLFKRWLKAPSHTLVTLRDPHLQLMSMMRQNTITFFSLDHRPSAEEMFEKYAHELETMPMGDSRNRTFLQFFVDKWTALASETLTLNALEKRVTYFDTTIMRHSPIKTFQKIISKLQLPVTDVSICISGFKDRPMRFVDSMEIDRTATQQAYASDSIRPIEKGESVSPERFSGEFVKALAVASAVYKNLMQSPHILYAPSLEEVSAQSWNAERGTTLVDVHPFTATAAVFR